MRFASYALRYDLEQRRGNVHSTPMDPDIIVFSKPWPTLGFADLCRIMKQLDVNGIELPVRSGFNVTPENAENELPKVARILSDEGLKVVSVAGAAEEPIIAACAVANVPIIRIMVRIPPERRYFEVVDETRTKLSRLEGILRGTGVVIGIQNHCDRFVGSAVGLLDLVEPLSADTVGVILDPAHCALDGEPVDMAIDIVRERLVMVNMKSAFRRRINGVNTDEAEWRTEWCTARDSGYSWKETVQELAGIDFDGPICLPAEYSDPDTGKLMEGDRVFPNLGYDRGYLGRLLIDVRG